MLGLGGLGCGVRSVVESSYLFLESVIGDKVWCLCSFLVLFRHQRDVPDLDDSMTANLIEDETFGTQMMTFAAKQGHLGYFLFCFRLFILGWISGFEGYLFSAYGISSCIHIF